MLECSAVHVHVVTSTLHRMVAYSIAASAGQANSGHLQYVPSAEKVQAVTQDTTIKWLPGRTRRITVMAQLTSVMYPPHTYIHTQTQLITGRSKVKVVQIFLGWAGYLRVTSPKDVTAGMSACQTPTSATEEAY